jgi:hypothetical protein
MPHNKGAGALLPNNRPLERAPATPRQIPDELLEPGLPGEYSLLGNISKDQSSPIDEDVFFDSGGLGARPSGQ